LEWFIFIKKKGSDGDVYDECCGGGGGFFFRRRQEDVSVVD
jgi:hypothetical protein